jgi:hypothetical protein
MPSGIPEIAVRKRLQALTQPLKGRLDVEEISASLKAMR